MARPETGWTTPSEEPASDGPEWPAGVEIPTHELDEKLIVIADDTGKTAEPPAGTVSGSVMWKPKTSDGEGEKID